MVDDFVAFMVGGDERFTKDLTRRMLAASAAMDYEAAAKYRDKLASIEAVLGKSALVLPADEDADLFGLAEDELSAAVHHFVIRGGRVRGVRSLAIDKEIDISGAELVDQVLQRVYGDAVDIPQHVTEEGHPRARGHQVGRFVRPGVGARVVRQRGQVEHADDREREHRVRGRV